MNAGATSAPDAGASHHASETPEDSPPVEPDALVLIHVVVAPDIERSSRFSRDVLGGVVVRSGQPAWVTLANSWIIINAGGGPTDKPDVTLGTPHDSTRASSFPNIRVAGIHAACDGWKERGARFLTPPIRRETGIRWYLTDPDDHLIEVGQTTVPSGWRPPPRSRNLP